MQRSGVSKISNDLIKIGIKERCIKLIKSDSKNKKIVKEDFFQIFYSILFNFLFIKEPWTDVPRTKNVKF